MHQSPYPARLLDHLSKAIEAHVELAAPPSVDEPEPEPIKLQGGRQYE